MPTMKDHKGSVKGPLGGVGGSMSGKSPLCLAGLRDLTASASMLLLKLRKDGLGFRVRGLSCNK